MDRLPTAMAAYLAVLGLLSVNGLHRLWLVAEVLRRPAPAAPTDPDPWPLVTVQVPLYDERYVAERVIRAVAALDYPALEIQILDDSTDETTAIAARVVSELAAAGVDIALLHRADRRGFKAGALAAGLARARGELVAVFDADFVPPADFLRRAVPWMTEGVGMVQARWGHLNVDRAFTRAQATLLDGHFAIEHTARHRAGRWFNFNGTAGVWRRVAIEDAGGWAHDTLTEDLDLSYRAQLAGWRFVFLPDLVAPAELPADLRAFLAQQHRWAKGTTQTARKLLGRILRAKAPAATKLEAAHHLLANLSHPLLVTLAVLMPFAVAERVAGDGGERGWLLVVDTVLFGFALVPFLLYYGLAVARTGGGARRWLELPVVLALGAGVSVNQTRAVLEGLGARVGTFVRTPKAGAQGARGYAARAGRVAWVELALATWLAAAAAWTLAQGAFGPVPFLALFVAGYGGVAVASLREAWRSTAAPAAAPSPAPPQTIHQSQGSSVQEPSRGSNPASTR